MFRVVAIFVLWTAAGCQTVDQANLNTKSMYRPVREHLQQGDIDAARESFPQREQGQFITTMEKAWLGLLSGEVETDELVKLSQTLEDRKTVRFRHEARRFFLKELDEAYLPAEHEVILFHVITGLIFARKDRSDLARVEAKRAAHYLQGHFGDHGGDFDDPAIRILLAALWLYCDEWQHARVDFRVAGKLAKDYAWAARLAKRESPPQSLVVVMQGVGPEIVWTPDDEASQRWQLQFLFTEEQQQMQMQVAGEGTEGAAMPAPLSSKNWYIRHFERDSAPRTALDNVRHGADVAVGAVGAAGAAMFAFVGATIIVVGAVAVSVAMVALAGATKSSDLVGAALGASGELMKTTMPVAIGMGSAGVVEGANIYANAADESEGYRFVRFLPSLYSYQVFDTGLTQPRLKAGKQTIQPLMQLTSAGGNRVWFYFLPR